MLGVDDNGKAMQVSPDPMLPELQTALKSVRLGEPDSADDVIASILGNKNLFGVSLNDIGLAEKVTGMFKELLSGSGAVRATLKKYLR